MIAVRWKPEEDPKKPKREFTSTRTYAFFVVLVVVAFLSLLFFFASHAR
jgi:preprotein translocase subunit SecE